MSFKFWMYRAQPGLPPVTEWSDNLAEDLGPRELVCQSLAELLLSVKWRSHQGDASFGEAFEPRYGCSYHIGLHLNQAGSVFMVTTSNHASPHTLSAIMDRFALNHCCTDFGDFRQPHACNDRWEIVGRQGQ